MGNMFNGAMVFNQNLALWDMSNVTSVINMFNNADLSVSNYDATLIGWNTQSLQPNLTLGAVGLQYCNSEAARQNMITSDGWTFIGDSKDPLGCATLTPVTTPDMTNSTDTGLSNTDNVTNDTTPDFIMACTDGNTVTLYVDGVASGTAVCVAGTATITSTTVMTNGVHSITYTETNTLTSESGQSPTLSITIDTTVPTAPTVDTTNAGSTTITGTGENGSVITLNLGVCTNAPVIVSGGVWSCILNPADSPTAGETVTVTSADTSGNTSNGSYTIPVPISGGGGAALLQMIPVVTTVTNTNNQNTKPNLISDKELNVSEEFSPYVCNRYLKEYIYPGKQNNPEEVKKLQTFLNKQGENLVVNGIYDTDSINAVKRFQEKYKDQILSPWGLTVSTGIVYRTTTAKINLMSCAKNMGCPYFTENLKPGSSSIEAVKVQDFLNIIFAPTSGYPTKGIPLSKTMTNQTVNKVREYQTIYKDSVLKPLNLTSSTGWWYDKSKGTANILLGCTQ
jgi:hypothetical protein